MIYKQVSESDFIKEFQNMGRGEQFTYDGLVALYEYLENYSEETGAPVELDVIALCCEYTQYDSLEELQAVYPHIKDFEDLNNHTTVIEVDDAMKTGAFIIADF